MGEASVTLICDWWMVIFPGMFITVTVLAFNLLGDGCAMYWTRECAVAWTKAPRLPRRKRL